MIEIKNNKNKNIAFCTLYNKVHYNHSATDDCFCKEEQRAKVFHAHNIFVFFIINIEQIYLFHSFNEWIACNMGWGMRGSKKKKIENVSSYYWACTVLIFIQCLLVVAYLIYTLSSQSIITSFRLMWGRKYFSYSHIWGSFINDVCWKWDFSYPHLGLF